MTKKWVNKAILNFNCCSNSIEVAVIDSETEKIHKLILPLENWKKFLRLLHIDV